MKLVSTVYNLFLGEMRLFYYIFRVFPVDSKKILFCSYYGKGYGCNPKYIAEEIIRQNLGYDMRWLIKKGLEKDHGLPPQIKPVRYGSLRAVFEHVTAGVWVDNSRKTGSIRKRKEQFYIQTWHGSLGIKRLERDVEHVLDKSYVKRAINDSKMTDIFLSNCSYFRDIVATSYWYDGEIMNQGLPRNDIMFGDIQAVKHKVWQHFNLQPGTKIALYAPTFRKSYAVDIYDIDIEIVLSALEKRFGGSWAFLVRLHPNISHKDMPVKYDHRILNASHYNDIQELVASTDVGISDFSGTMYDFGLMRLPCFLYTPDIEAYMQDRNFYFPMSELPFIITRNNAELEKAILEFDQDAYKKRLEAHLETKEVTDDGNASSYVVQRIKDHINSSPKKLG